MAWHRVREVNVNIGGLKPAGLFAMIDGSRRSGQQPGRLSRF